MSKIIDLYLDRLLHTAELPEPRATELRAELSDHLHTSYEAALASGEKPEDAAFKAIQKMGEPKAVGNKISRPWQWIDIRTEGTARGFIAIGPKAIGVIACGNISCGVFSVGVISTGLIAFGALSFGIFTWAAIAAGLVSIGGMAIGMVATGGVAVGWLAEGLATVAPATSPEFLQSLLTFPRWMMQHMGVIAPIYSFGVAILAARGATLRKRKQASLDHWIFG